MTTRSWGPGLLVTAAFIGPGTVKLASQSGANFGFSLLWVVLFAVLAAIVFQEMAARLGVVSGQDLSQALSNSSSIQSLNWLIIVLVLGAVLIGNAAYQAGNIAGAATGLKELSGWSAKFWAVVIGAVAIVILMIGRFSLIQNVLISLVAMMSLLFIVSAVIVRPDWAAVGRGLVVPRIDDGALMTVVGLLGTTVVPYNLFLHSRSAVENWHTNNMSQKQIEAAVSESRRDTVWSIVLGGAITMAILITASAAFFQQGLKLDSLPEIASQLRPLLGGASEWIFCLGLAAAGLTSAITAPLAAGFVASGCFGWGRDLRDWRTRGVMLVIIAIGLSVIFLAEGVSPSQIIVIAQVANGLILPIIAIFLMVVMNRAKGLRTFRNGPVANAFGGFVIVVVSILAFRQFSFAWSTIQKWLAPVEAAAGTMVG